MTSKTFIELVLAGEADMGEVDDFVERWHDGKSDGSLHDYLGLSWEDYAAWVADHGALQSIVEQLRADSSVVDS